MPLAARVRATAAAPLLWRVLHDGVPRVLSGCQGWTPVLLLRCPRMPHALP